jgi:hypothetical protein
MLPAFGFGGAFGANYPGWLFRRHLFFNQLSQSTPTFGDVAAMACPWGLELEFCSALAL